MDNIKLKLNSDSYIEILIDFDITEYVSGDIIIKYFSDDVEVFSRDTQLKYIVDLLILAVNGLIVKEKIFEYYGGSIVADYMKFINGEPDCHDTNAKVFIDFSNDDGCVAFMYWTQNGSYVEISKADGKNIVWDEKVNISANRLKTWKSKLDKLSAKIGSKCNSKK